MANSPMYRLWLIFSQAATIAVAALFVVSTFRPEWLPAARGRTGRSVDRATEQRRADAGRRA